MAALGCMLYVLLVYASANPDDSCSSDGICPEAEAAGAMLQYKKESSSVVNLVEEDETLKKGCKTSETAWDHNGKAFMYNHGQAYWLDRHPVGCDAGSALNNFRVHADARAARIMIRFECCPFPSGSTSKDKVPPPFRGQDKRALNTLIGRPAVACDTGLLSKWRVTPQVGVDYECTEPAAGHKLTCSDKTTPWADFLGLNYLDRHTVKCPSDQLMSSWDMIMNGQRMHVKYGCCKVTALSCSESQTKFNDIGVNSRWPSGQTFYLDRHKVTCEKGSALSKFSFSTRDANHGRMQIKSTCCEIPGGTEEESEWKQTVRHGGSRTSLQRLINNGEVDCGPDGVIKNWHVTSQSDVKYQCTTLKEKPICRLKETPANPDYGVIYLDKHDVHCPPREVMQSWDILSVGGSKMVFRYTCCQV